jgi:hypothetical protein
MQHRDLESPDQSLVLLTTQHVGHLRYLLMMIWVKPYHGDYRQINSPFQGGSRTELLSFPSSSRGHSLHILHTLGTVLQVAK